MQRRILALAVVAFTACGSGEEATSTLESEQVVAGASAAMAAIESAAFEIELRGAPVEIEGLEFVRAKGDYSAPSSAAAVLEMRVGTVTVEMSTISIEDRTWLTDPITAAWGELPQGVGFNPAIVFGAEGWVALLAEDLSGVAVRREGGIYRLNGPVSARRVERLTAGIVTDQQVDIGLSVDSATLHVLTADFVTESAGGSTDWHIQLGSFDRTVVIEAPTTG